MGFSSSVMVGDPVRLWVVLFGDPFLRSVPDEY